MYGILMGVHVTVCVLMILVVLMQAGRGAGLAVFGGGGGDALFQTPSGTSFMRQLTAWLAISFGVTSLLLTLVGGRSGMSSVTTSFPAQAPMKAPAAPGAAQPQAPASQPAKK